MSRRTQLSLLLGALVLCALHAPSAWRSLRELPLAAPVHAAAPSAAAVEQASLAAERARAPSSVPAFWPALSSGRGLGPLVPAAPVRPVE